MQDKLLSTKELSEYLGIAVSTIIEYRMNNSGPIYAKLGHLARDFYLTRFISIPTTCSRASSSRDTNLVIVSISSAISLNPERLFILETQKL